MFLYILKQIRNSNILYQSQMQQAPNNFEILVLRTKTPAEHTLSEELTLKIPVISFKHNQLNLQEISGGHRNTS